MYLKTSAKLNQRNEPNENAKIIQTIPRNNKVKWSGYVAEVNNKQWYLVEYNNHLGFCLSTYLKEVK